MIRTSLVTSALLAAVLPAQNDWTWPQGPGPSGDWQAVGPPPPTSFSVRTGENLRWRTPLPETGQGGIAVWNDRLFVTTMAPWDAERGHGLSAEEAARFAHAIEKRTVVGKHIDGHCLDAETGEILWTRRIEGAVPSIYSYPFSDATSASPVTDGMHVWFTNAGGRVACFTVEGEPVWTRDFEPTIEGPFNKQFEPFLVENRMDGQARKVLVAMEPFPAPEGEGRWHHLVGLDANSGEPLWRSEDALTHYNAPTLVDTASGTCALVARGGPHDVPERPVGVSLVRVAGADAGTTVWRYEDPRGNHEGSLQTMAHDDRFAYWLLKKPHNALVVLDLATGEAVREISLTEDVTVRAWNEEGYGWKPPVEATLEQGVFPARYSMIAANDHVFFQCYATAWGKRTIDPPWSFARVHPISGEVCYLEVPTGVERQRGGDRWTWRTPGGAKAINSRGEEVTGDDRSRWDGWDWVFNGSPTAIGNTLYFTLASGLVYVLDAGRDAFDGGALLAVSDLGPAGETWTANSASIVRGRIYHRTAREVMCFGQGQPAADISTAASAAGEGAGEADENREWRAAIDALLDDRYGDPDASETLAARMVDAGLDAAAVEALVRSPRLELTPPQIPRGKLVARIPLRCEHVDYETTMLLYVPETLPQGLVPLVFVAHGGNGAMPASYAERAAAGGTMPWTRQADEHGFILVAPLTERGWGSIGNSILLSAVSQLKRWYPIDPDRVHVTGHSMGGHMTWRTALNMADRYGGLGPMSGGYDFVDKKLMERLWNSAGYVTFGKTEPYGIDRDNRTMRTWLGEHPDYRWTLVEKDGGHEIFADEMPKVAKFVLDHPRDPYPRSVYFEGNATLAWTDPGSNERWKKEHTWNPDRPLRQSISHWFEGHPNPDLPQGERQRACARIDGQTIHVVSSHVRGATLHLHPRMLDLAKPVKVVVNGATAFEGSVEPDLAHLLRTARAFDDRGRVYHAAIELTIDSDAEAPDPAEFAVRSR